MNTLRITHLKSFVGAGAIALGVAITVNAPASYAERISEGTIKSECKAAGGNYNTEVRKGHRYSTCFYADADGDLYIDSYSDGEYQDTVP